MVRLADVQKQADELSREDREGLLSHLLHSLEDAPTGASDEEILQRDEDMERGDTAPIDHNQFTSEARRRDE